MPKTNLCKSQELAPSSTPAFEFCKLIVGTVVTKITVGHEHFLKEKYGIKITSSKKVRDTYKPYGDLIISIYDLVKEFSMYDRLMPGIPYNSPSIWFEQCILELTTFEVKSLGLSNASYFGWGNLKKELKTYYRDGDYDLQKLSVDNPFAKRGLTALALLVEYAAVASETSRKFQKDYWRPLVKAVGEVSTCTSKRKDWEPFTASATGEILQQNKRGVPRYLPFLDVELLLKLCT